MVEKTIDDIDIALSPHNAGMKAPTVEPMNTPIQIRPLVLMCLLYYES
jgi:hypothetical protein